MRTRIAAILLLAATMAVAQPAERRRMRAFTTDTAMVHDPVMAYDNGVYYMMSTGHGIQLMTSIDRKTWTMVPHPVITDIPSWTHDSVPEFKTHVWAPDLFKWHGKWWLTYSCSSFAKNTSAIGVMCADTLCADTHWEDCGAVVCSQRLRDNWNAIDSNIIIDENDCPWMVWGSFWGGIQLARLDATMHLAQPREQKVVATRHCAALQEEPGTNAIEAPFIFWHGGYYYLFVSYDYCCRGIMWRWEGASR